jgi:hypothetical protein
MTGNQVVSMLAEITTLMKSSCLLDGSVTLLSTYSVDYCAKNTFTNCVQANKRTHCLCVLLTKTSLPILLH